MIALIGVLPSLPAQAEQPKEVWSATLTPAAGQYDIGCDELFAGIRCTSQLSDVSFTYDGQEYTVWQLAYQASGGGVLSLKLSGIPANLKNDLSLRFGNHRLSLQDATKRGPFLLTWSGSSFPSIRDNGWSVGEEIEVRLVERYVPTLTPLPHDHTVTPVPASQRRPENGPASDAFCYTGDGGSSTTIIIRPDGTRGEVPTPSKYIRSLFACN